MLIMDLSMSMIDDNSELHVNRILENVNLGEFELIDLLLEQLGDSLQEHTPYGHRNGSHNRHW